MTLLVFLEVVVPQGSEPTNAVVTSLHARQPRPPGPRLFAYGAARERVGTRPGEERVLSLWTVGGLPVRRGCTEVAAHQTLEVRMGGGLEGGKPRPVTSLGLAEHVRLRRALELIRGEGAPALMVGEHHMDIAFHNCQMLRGIRWVCTPDCLEAMSLSREELAAPRRFLPPVEVLWVRPVYSAFSSNFGSSLLVDLAFGMVENVCNAKYFGTGFPDFDDSDSEESEDEDPGVSAGDSAYMQITEEMDLNSATDREPGNFSGNGKAADANDDAGGDDTPQCCQFRRVRLIPGRQIKWMGFEISLSCRESPTPVVAGDEGWGLVSLSIRNASGARVKAARPG